MDEAENPTPDGYLHGQIAVLLAISAELLIGLAATQAKLTLGETTSSQLGQMRGKLENRFAIVGEQMAAVGMAGAAQGVADTMAAFGGMLEAFPPNDNELGAEGSLLPSSKPGG